MLDGKLTATERARLTEHLAGCESCYEIFAGAAHILDDHREELKAAAAALPFERSREARALRPRVWWAAAALAAVLAMTVGLVVFLRGTGAAGPTTEQLASLVGPIPTGDFAWGRTLRGGSETEAQPMLPTEREAFELGVRFLDLRLALASGNREAAEEGFRRLLNLFDRMLLRPSPKTTAPYTEMRRELPQVPPPTLAAAAAAAEKKVLAELAEDPRTVELGRWTEACRLAGKTGRAGLFHQPATLRVLDEAMRPGGKEEDTLDPQAVGIVRSIREDIASGRINPTLLGGSCEKLLNDLARDDQ